MEKLTKFKNMLAFHKNTLYYIRTEKFQRGIYH